METVNLRSIDVGFCVRCQRMPVNLPVAAVLCVEYDGRGSCAPAGGDVHGDPVSYTGPRDDVIATLRAEGFVIADVAT
jgi:hypothetical protein